MDASRLQVALLSRHDLLGRRHAVASAKAPDKKRPAARAAPGDLAHLGSSGGALEAHVAVDGDPVNWFWV